LAIVFVACF